MNYFLSCDWGTTTFRIRLADSKDGSVSAEEVSGEGIALVFDLWQQSGYPEEKRIGFYLDVVNRHIQRIEKKLNQSLKGVKLIISGMASSSIGFTEVAYQTVPLPVDGSGVQTAFIGAGNGFEHDVLIISGVKTADEVMRGEETQLIGCIKPGSLIKNEWYIFPGTHSKHILVKDNQVTDFKTYMTGELFGLLAQKSILKNAVEFCRNDESGKNMGSFKTGVKDAVGGNLLNAIFRVRTNQLFDVFTKNENYNYLSGLLIGTELKDLAAAEADATNLVCGEDLSNYYHHALMELMPEKNINIFSARQADTATVMGHLKIGNELKIFA